MMYKSQFTKIDPYDWFCGVLCLIIPFYSSPFESMAAHRTACGKVIKCGTQIEEYLNIKHRKFGVSNSNCFSTTSSSNGYANNF